MPDAQEPEPSMDEILASIRRIIADDGGKIVPAEDAPLLLTERVDPTPPETVKPMTETPHTEPDAAPDSEWIGEAAAVQTSSAFDKLAALEPAPAEPIAMPPPGRSLEDLTRDMLRPMLKEWLDDNLPRIVQDRVDEEVERLARRRVR